MLDVVSMPEVIVVGFAVDSIPVDILLDICIFVVFTVVIFFTGKDVVFISEVGQIVE